MLLLLTVVRSNGSLKTIVTLAFRGTFCAFEAGLMLTSEGGVVVTVCTVKPALTVSIWTLFADSVVCTITLRDARTAAGSIVSVAVAEVGLVTVTGPKAPS